MIPEKRCSDCRWYVEIDAGSDNERFRRMVNCVDCIRYTSDGTKENFEQRTDITPPPRTFWHKIKSFIKGDLV